MEPEIYLGVDFDPRYVPDKEIELDIKDNSIELPSDCAYIHQILIPKSNLPIDGRMVYVIDGDKNKVYFATHNAVTRTKMFFPSKLKVIYMSVQKYEQLREEENEKDFWIKFWYKRKEQFISAKKN